MHAWRLAPRACRLVVHRMACPTTPSFAHALALDIASDLLMPTFTAVGCEAWLHRRERNS